MIQLLCVFQEEITDPAPSEIADSSTTIRSQTVSEPDPFKKFQDIRHQDFGEIVFRKTKKSKKKANKGTFIKWVFLKPNPVKDEVGYQSGLTVSNWISFRVQRRPECLLRELEYLYHEPHRKLLNTYLREVKVKSAYEPMQEVHQAGAYLRFL